MRRFYEDILYLEVFKGKSLSDQGVEPLDLLGILYELGVSLQEYTSGEKLNNKGKKLILEVLKIKGYTSEVETFSMKDEISISEFFDLIWNLLLFMIGPTLSGV